jgi:prevent-host-death family protein
MEFSVAEVHNHLSSLLKQVEKGPITITRRGKTVGVIISPAEYESLRQVQAYIQMIDLSHELHESASAQDLYRLSRQDLDQDG